MSKSRAPEITSLDPGQLQKLLVQLQQHLPAALYESVAALLGTLQWLMGVIEKKNATMGRLQRLIFGAQTEKTRNVFPGKGVAAPTVARKRRVRGHGRNGASQYGRPRFGDQRVTRVGPHLGADRQCNHQWKGSETTRDSIVEEYSSTPEGMAQIN